MGPEHAVAAVIVLGLVLYVLGGGADFGGGVWDLLASGPRKEEQRALIERAIGPVWEANHVWFVFVFVLLFSAFPPAFAHLTTSLFDLLTAYAVGIVLRGSAFTFRHYETDARKRRRFGALFSAASIGCPMILGATGALLVRDRALTSDLRDPFVIASSVFFLALVAALAAATLLDALGISWLRRETLVPIVSAAVVGALQAVAWSLRPDLLRRAAVGGVVAGAAELVLVRAPLGWLELGALGAGPPGALPLVVLPIVSVLAVIAVLGAPVPAQGSPPA